MVKGRWNPDASSATAYAWFVWRAPATGETRFMWIPPSQRGALTKESAAVGNQGFLQLRTRPRMIPRDSKGIAMPLLLCFEEGGASP
jgi:hypothetical protein